ncbi:MAG: TonB-dependent receptor [Pseudomonadota bacterium]
MTKTTARHALSGISALAVAATLQTPQAHAQESGFENIVITARRSEESLQDVPATVAVVTQATLQKVNATTAEDVIELIPGVTIVTNTAEVGDTQINIRGINGARDGESSVALVVDGILKTNTAVLNQVQNNLTQIEILKGPQGAYYGRNAAAGAIVMSTRKPGEEWEFFGEASYGNNDTVTGAVTAAGPINDSTGILVSADYRKTDGFFRNTGPVASANGATVDQYEGYTIQSRVMSQLTDEAALDLKVRYADISAGSINYNVAFQVPGLAAAFMQPAFNLDVNDQEFVYNANVPSDGNQQTVEFSAKLDWEFDGFDLTAWGLYSSVKQDLIADGAVAAFGFFNSSPECIQSTADITASGFQLPAPLFLTGDPGTSVVGAFSPLTCDGTQYQVRDQEDISFELRLASNTEAPLQWSVGAYYLNIDRRVGVAVGYDRGRGVVPNLFNNQFSANPTQQLSDDTFKTNVFAIFGSAEYELREDLTLSAALRWDSENRKVSNNVPADVIAPFPDLMGNPIPLNIGLQANGMIPDQEETFAELQPRISLAWAPLDNLNVFASWGVGFKSGGFNNSGSEATIETIFNDVLNAGLSINDNFRKETSSAFELGAKGTLFDNRMQFEIAGYYTKIDDMQFFEFFAGPFGILRVVSNIDEVEVLGIEGSVNVRVMDGVNVFASANYNDSEIKENSARPGTVGGESPYTPQYTLNAGFDVTQPINYALDATFRLDYNYVGPTWFHTAQEGDRPSLFGVANYTNSQRDAFGVLNLRAGVQGENWSLIAFAENVTNKEYLDEVIPAPEFGGSFTSPGARRYYGVQGRFNF